MKKTLALMIFMLILASHAGAAGLGWSAAHSAGPPATPSKKTSIEQRLEKLAVAFAGALEERDFRELLKRSLAASESGDGVRLRDLVDQEVVPGGAARRPAPAGAQRATRSSSFSRIPPTSTSPPCPTWKPGTRRRSCL